MKEKHCRPDSETFSIMMEAYAKEGMNDKVYALEQEKMQMLSEASGHRQQNI